MLPLELKVLLRLVNEAVKAHERGDVEGAQEHLSKLFGKTSEAYATAQRILNSPSYINHKAGELTT